MEDVDVLVISETERTMQMFMGDPVLVGFLSFMTLWFVLSIFQIFHAYGSVTSRFKKLTKEMIESAGLKPDELERVAMTDEIKDAWEESFSRHKMKRHWVAFRSNIITYRGSGALSMPRSFLADFFGAENIERDSIPIRIGRRSTFLISIGVLGTFLGLAIGVNEAASGLASPNVRIARAALTDLLDGAGLAFVTSLFGLGMGTILNWILGRQQQRLKNTITVFQDAISEMVHVVSDPMMVVSSVNTRFGDLNDHLEELGNKLAKEDSHTRHTMVSMTSPLEVELQNIRRGISGMSDHLEKAIPAAADRTKDREFEDA